MNPVNLDQLDSHLSYKLKNPDSTDFMTFRGLGDGTWRLATGGKDTSVLLREDGLRRHLESWQTGGGLVVPFACCCHICSTPVMQQVVKTAGWVSHGLWPECFETERNRVLSGAI